MAVQRIHDQGQTLGMPTGKILGIVNTTAEFDGLVQALRKAGFERVQTLCGNEGVQLLERADGFFFSDAEERVLERYRDELKEGHIVIGIETPRGRVEEVVTVATEHGARTLVDFGLLTVTKLTK